MIRVFINGFGRIGRHVARIILEDKRFELVGINDLGSFEQIPALLKKDSIYGTFSHEVTLINDQLYVDQHAISLFSIPHPSNLHLDALNVDIVLACCGMFLTQESCQPFLEAGAKKVIVSTPPKDKMPIFIYGVNHTAYNDEKVISNSSCSANAIVPIFKIVDALVTIESAMLSMYHSYTSYQRLLDSKHYAQDIRRTRSATQNIIPLQSSAAEATAAFFPHLKEKLYAKSIRIPLAAVTLYDLTLHTQKTIDPLTLSQKLEQQIKSLWKNILDITDTPKVSSDYIQSPYSAIVDTSLVSVCEKNLIRVGAWQDNEYGYAKRLVDMAVVVGS